MDFIVINLNDWDRECLLCGTWGRHRHCVPYYEEPRPDLEIGQIIPGGQPDDVVCGMSCCKECHDTIYELHHESQRVAGN